MRATRTQLNTVTPSLPQHWQLWVALALLALMLVQLLGAATKLSATIDEGFHITSGYEYLRTGRLRLFDEHIPLVKALFAWPLFLVPDLTPPEKALGWTDGNLILVAQETVLAYQPIDRVIVPPRIVVALLTLLLGASVFRWATDLFGPTAGVFALALFAFDPNILAHGCLATTDMGAVAFIFWAVWAFARYLHNPASAEEKRSSARRWWTAALLLGLAQGAKLTALLLLPVLGLVGLVDAWTKADRDQIRATVRRALSYSGMVAVAALIVWALYLFEIRALPRVADGTLPLPAASHIERWLRLQDNIAYGRESFLLGQNSMHGWWQYFPVAFALKTPLLTLLVIGLTALLTAGALISKQRRRLTQELALALFPLVYGAASLTSTLNIGYRHLLSILPFVLASAGRVACGPASASMVRARWQVVIHYTLLAIVIVGLCIGTLSIHPHYLAFFNLVAGGADQGYRFLADSNTDWGQTLKALRDYQTRNGLGPVKLSLFTFLDPAIYGVIYEPIAPMRDAPSVLPRRFNPSPGLYAISATTLDGIPLPLPSMYNWFRHREPLERVGHVMFLYDVVADDSQKWVAQCTVPAVPLPPEVINEGFGSDQLRRVYFDCQQSWIFPDGSTSGGWYACTTLGIDSVHWPTEGQHLEWWPAWVGELPLETLRLSYVQPAPSELSPFSIWEWPGTAIVPPLTSDSTITLNDTLEFLGYQAPQTVHQGAVVDVLTYWRVLDPPSRPLSLMLHLTGENDTPVAVGDGLGIPIDQWSPDDLIVQRHRLAIPADTLPGPYQVRSGAYWLDDLSRLTANGKGYLDVTQIQVIP